jgi:hypothetical protein
VVASKECWHFRVRSAIRQGFTRLGRQPSIAKRKPSPSPVLAQARGLAWLGSPSRPVPVLPPCLASPVSFGALGSRSALPPLSLAVTVGREEEGRRADREPGTGTGDARHGGRAEAGDGDGDRRGHERTRAKPSPGAASAASGERATASAREARTRNGEFVVSRWPSPRTGDLGHP